MRVLIAFLILCSSAIAQDVREYLIWHTRDAEKGSLHYALTDEHDGPKRIRTLIGGIDQLETDIRIDTQWPIDIDLDFPTPLVITGRGIKIDSIGEGSIFKNLCLYTGTRTVPKVIREPLASDVDGLYSWKFPEHIKKALGTGWKKFDRIIYSPTGLPRYQDYGSMHLYFKDVRQFPSLKGFATLDEVKANADSYTYDHGTGKLYLNLSNYAAAGHLYPGLRKSIQPDPLSFSPAVKGVTFENCTFAYGTDINVSMAKTENITFKNCLIHSGMNIATHSKVVEHSKGVWCDECCGTIFDGCVFTQVMDRAPLAQQAGWMIVCNSYSTGIKCDAVKIAQRGGGVEMDIYNNLIESKAGIRLIMEDNPLNLVHVGGNELNGTYYPDSWTQSTLSSTQQGTEPFVARTGFSLPYEPIPETGRSAETIFPQRPLIPIGELRPHLKANCGAYPNNRYQLCQKALDEMGSTEYPVEMDSFPAPDEDLRESFEKLAEIVEGLLNEQ